mgnify:CR=1 FL=1
MIYSKEQYITLSERFNKQSFLGKLLLIKQNPNLFTLEVDGTNVRLRLENDAMVLGLDSYFSFPEFFEYSHLKDIFSLADIKVKELK